MDRSLASPAVLEPGYAVSLALPLFEVSFNSLIVMLTFSRWTKERGEEKMHQPLKAGFERE